MKLTDLLPGLSLVGLEPDRVCSIIAVTPIAENAIQVFYKLPDGSFKERLLGPADEASISLATTERPWAFDGDPAAFQLACEAKRIDLAFREQGQRALFLQRRGAFVEDLGIHLLRPCRSCDDGRARAQK